MKTLTIEALAYCVPAEDYEFESKNVFDGFKYDFAMTDISKLGGKYIYAGTSKLVITLPENFDPRDGAVKALEKQKQQIKAEFQARITEIERQISQFQAITNEVKA